jgi:dienelactone hydrolase
MRMLTTLLVIMVTMLTAAAEIRTEPVTYKAGGTEMTGLLVYDDQYSGPRPGVLVVHEWWGLNDYPKARANQLAELGYIAFCADIFGGGKIATSPDSAKAMVTPFYTDRALLRQRVNAALDVLKRQKGVDPKRIAAIGYCFGGMTVLELARSGADLAAVVSFHGGLATPQPAKKGEIKARVLVCHGADDPHVPAEDVTKFQQEMRDCGADWQFCAYGGAVHAFTNPASGSDPAQGIAYNEAADKRSWKQMLALFSEVFD